MKTVFSLFFILPFVAMAGDFSLSETDSLMLMNEATFPVIKNEIVTEGGKKFNVQTRGLQSEDELLKFTCSQRYHAGIQVNALCTTTVFANAKVHEGNRLQTGVAGSLRATIGWVGDILKFNQVFRNIGACRPNVLTQLYVLQERKEITLPDGKKFMAPLVTIGCYGDASQHKLTQLIVTVFPR